MDLVLLVVLAAVAFSVVALIVVRAKRQAAVQERARMQQRLRLIATSARRVREWHEVD